MDRPSSAEPGPAPRGGRPRGIEEPLEPVTSKVPKPVKNGLTRLAQDENLTLSAYIARVLTRHVDQHLAGD